METLYPINYGTRLVTFDVLVASFSPHMHPEAARRWFNLAYHEGGKIGFGGGYRAPGTQPNKPGFAKEGQSFHGDQVFPSGVFYVAIDTVVVNPGHVHRAPTWSEVPKKGSQPALDYGIHMNVTPSKTSKGETWHGQPIELDGWKSWVNRGRPDLQYNRPLEFNLPRPQPPQPPVPPTQPQTTRTTVEFTSRNLAEGAVGPDVKFFQRIMNDIAGAGLLLDGWYGPTTTRAVLNWQRYFPGLADDGKLGPQTQRHMIEISLQAS
jgi:hypothetical protein